MPKQRITPDDFVKQVADTFRGAKTTKRTLTQQSGDAGTQGGQKFANPMDAIGQMIAGGESGALEQVPAGTEGQVVKMTDVGSGVLKPRFADEDAAVVALLDDIGDVNAPAPADGDVLTWDSTPGEWVPAAPTGGGSGAPTTATYITQTPDAGLSAEQALSALSTGLVKVTTGTGVLSTAVAGDLPAHTHAGADITDFTEAAQDAVGAMLLDTSSTTLTYNDATPSLSVGVKDEYVRDTMAATLVAGTNISITVDDPGDTITITNTAGGGGASVGNPLQTRVQRQVAKTPGAVTTFQTFGYATPAMNGTLAAADDADGPWVNCATSTTLNNTAGFTSSNDTDVRRDWSPDTTWAVKTDASAITGLAYWIGHSNTSLAQSATSAFHYAAFRYHTTADGTSFWRCVTDNASGTPTVTTTAVAIAANTKYVLRIAMTTSDVKFYIDTVLVATHTTTLPTATQTMGNQARVVNLVGGVGTARAIKFGRLGSVHGP